MIEKLLKPIKWFDFDDIHGNKTSTTATIICEYDVEASESGYEVNYYNRQTEAPSKTATGFKTMEEAKQWAWEHYIEKMTPYFNTDPLTEYAAKFTQWAKDRKIIQNGNLQTQTLKLVSETGELADNIAKGRDTKDDIGDSFVVLNNLVEMQGYTWQECLEQAWNDIKDRKGHMNEHGVFIKEGDDNGKS